MANAKATKKVWRVVGWDPWYEPTNVTRHGYKTPLPFTKLFTGAAGASGREAAQIAAQLRALEAKGLEVEGFFARVLRLVASRTHRRGYLLNHLNEPATNSEIALLLSTDTGTVRSHLATLSSRAIGLLEQVPWPPPKPHKKPTKKKTTKKKTTRKKAMRKKVTRKKATPKKRSPKASAGKRPTRSRRGRAGGAHPARTQRANAVTRELELEPEQEQEHQRKRQRPSAVGNGLNSTTKKRTASRTPKIQPERGRRKGKAEGPGRTGSRTPSSEAVKPTKADPGGSVGSGRKAAPPPRSDLAAHRVPLIGDAWSVAQAIVAAVYPTDARVYHHLRLSQRISRDPGDPPPDTAEQFITREVAAAEHAWRAVESLNLGAQQMAVLLGRANKEAAIIGRRKTAFRKPAGASWQYWLNHHMAALVGEGRWTNARALHQTERIAS